MYAIEFQSKIRNGIIEIPVSERDRLLSQVGDEAVRIIILAAGREQGDAVSTDDDLVQDAHEKGYGSFIDYLLDYPVQVPGVSYFSREEAHDRN